MFDIEKQIMKNNSDRNVSDWFLYSHIYKFKKRIQIEILTQAINFYIKAKKFLSVE